MKAKTRRNRIPRLFLTALAGILFIAVLWFLLSALFSAAPPINYVTSCSMYPEYSRADVLLVFPIKPDVPILDCPECSGEGNKWIVDFMGEQAAELDDSLSVYCASKSSLMCQYFAAMPEMFSETYGNVTFNFSKCNRTIGDVTTQFPCVSSVGPVNRTMNITQAAGKPIVVNERLTEYLPVVPVIHRAYFAVRDSSGNVNYFTKGDANPVFDSQTAGYVRLNSAIAANASSVRGVVLFKLPFLGEALRYLQKIPGCDGSELVLQQG